MTETDTDHLFLDRRQQRGLIDTLLSIPTLAEDIAVTLARMDRISRPGSTRRAAKSSVPEGVNLSAMDDWTTLHAILSSWVRMVCEEQALDPPDSSLIGLASWLRRHIVDLARCEGAGEAPDEIAHWVHQCRRHIDLPEDTQAVRPDDPRVALARHQADTIYATYGLIQSLCRKMDIDPVIDARRMKHIVRAQSLAPVGRDGNTKYWRLSDILDADTIMRQSSA